jgi:hypothetical protein
MAHRDSIANRRVYVVARETHEPDPEEGFAPMDPETWNLLKDAYQLISVWQQGGKVLR